MEKISFQGGVDGRAVEFYVLEQTRLAGEDFLLVTDREEGDARCWILKKLSEEGGACEDTLYEMVEDGETLDALGKIFEELLDDVEID